MSKFEITKVVKGHADFADYLSVDGESFYQVEYKVRINKKVSMTKELLLWATDELDAYNKAKHKIGKESNNVIQSN